jgi:hypothetical protein
LHYRDADRLSAALPLLDGACPIADAPPNLPPLILEELS